MSGLSNSPVNDSINHAVDYAITDLNQMDQAEFTAVLGVIFEHTPEIAAQAWLKRPFANVIELHQVMAHLVQTMDASNQLRLICAHPDLGDKLKMSTMAEASIQEQSTVGLDQLSSSEYTKFKNLNDAYKRKFGFPFIIAVRNHTKESILSAFEKRIQHELITEQQQAITEIIEIARWRLVLLIREQ